MVVVDHSRRGRIIKPPPQHQKLRTVLRGCTEVCLAPSSARSNQVSIMRYIRKEKKSRDKVRVGELRVPYTQMDFYLELHVFGAVPVRKNDEILD